MARPSEIIFIYDHFYPDYTAGGPITALVNLTELLKGNSKIRVITSAFEYQTKRRLNAITTDEWSHWKDVPVWYAKDWRSIRKALMSLDRERSIIYLNGVFSIHYFLLPLWIGHRSEIKIIISPRGMLQSGAIKNGAKKKKIYLQLLSLSGLLKNVRWHATDKQESKDILKWLSKPDAITIPDVPFNFIKEEHFLRKEQGALRIVYYSLITQKKNLLFFLKLMNRKELENVKLDIIGPIKDREYWNSCLQFVSQIPAKERITYRGEITPDAIAKTLPNYHALILPTHGENFGHAIIEMLACSRPVIISDKTPWNDLEELGAGYAVGLDQPRWIAILKTMIDWNQEAFDETAAAAYNYYQSKFNFDDLKMRYLDLFSIPS